MRRASWPYLLRCLLSRRQSQPMARTFSRLRRATRNSYGGRHPMKKGNDALVESVILVPGDHMAGAADIIDLQGGKALFELPDTFLGNDVALKAAYQQRRNTYAARHIQQPVREQLGHRAFLF